MTQYRLFESQAQLDQFMQHDQIQVLHIEHHADGTMWVMYQQPILTHIM